jgi:predicted RNase H-like HicB family nuclease
VTLQHFTFDVVIEKEAEDEGFFAYCPALPGCFSSGSTIEETRSNMKDALEQHVASLLAHGDDVPQVSRTVLVETLSLAVPA